MSAGTLTSLADYLSTSYSPDREYRDGVLVERNLGDRAHARLQALLTAYLCRRRKQWAIEAYTELRIRVREGWYPIPDVCVYDGPGLDERYPSRPPLLWIEILSQDDRVIDVWNKANDLLEHGVPFVWIIDPNTLESELRTPNAVVPVVNKVLRLPDSPIVIDLAAVLDE